MSDSRASAPLEPRAEGGSAPCDGGAEAKEEDTLVVLREGWLTKSDPYGKRWKRRWIILDEDKLAYFESKGGKEKGRFSIEEAEYERGWTIQLPTPTPYLFRLAVPGRIYNFCCDTLEELNEWQDTLKVALDDYPPPPEELSEEGELPSGSSTESATAGASGPETAPLPT